MERARRGGVEAPAAVERSGEPTETGNGWREVVIPEPPDLEHHVVDDISLRDVFDYVNPQMLYAKHLGLRGSIERLREEGDVKAAKLEEAVEALKDKVIERGLMTPRAVYRYYVAASTGNAVTLSERPGGETAARFDFPRQPDRERLSLADWVARSESGKTDYIAAFVTTCGEGVREQAEAWKQEGEYLKSYALQALAIEAAEGYAELLHQRIRTWWGIHDPNGMSQKDLFQTKYRGIRVSFGYPACPNLEDQAPLWKLLEPDRHIGVELTEGFMMDPEASVSALVFHHPDARYFSVSQAMAEAN
jgi:5-methyltetrahydrofolate--homocysteine methyltransferase